MSPTRACGGCRLSSEECRCALDARTESAASLLAGIADPNLQHLCLFVYHPYQRWQVREEEVESENEVACAADDEFTAACMPPWEGWYAAWLRPEVHLSYSAEWTDEPILPCALHYHDGSTCAACIEASGRLTVMMPAPRPPDSLGYDPDRSVLRQRVEVTQTLALNEIRTGSRGVVHGTNGGPNNGRRVSHVVEVGTGGRAVVCTIPEEAGGERERVGLDERSIRKFAPHLWEEFACRKRRRFMKRDATQIGGFLMKMLARSWENDAAVRYALSRKWRSEAGMAATGVRRLRQATDDLREMFRRRGAKDYDDNNGSEGPDEQRSRKRHRN